MPIHVWKTRFLKKRPLIRCIFLFFVFVQCRPLEVAPVADTVDASPHLQMRGWETVVTNKGQKRVQVRADSLLRDQAQGRAYFEGQVRVVFFDGKGKPASTLSATKGSVDPDGQYIMVKGNVVVVADSTRLETDSLRWDRANERIYGDGLVSIFRPEGQEQGVGFDASADLKQWTLKQVQTQVIGKTK